MVKGYGCHSVPFFFASSAVFLGGGLGGFWFGVFGFFQYSTNYTLLRPSTRLSKLGKILISFDHKKIKIPFNFTS